ncbi:hypothetical protein [Lactococcus formosensis]|uniref:hypothetical protein n=1 Tax=Lactococcus formosensis TaxID=1281486 RepID=UPI002550A5F1|nr:hypothetical protein [Lactococcus formosensis]
MKLFSSIESKRDSITAKQATVALLELFQAQGKTLLIELAKYPAPYSFKDFKLLVDKCNTTLQFISNNHNIGNNRAVIDVENLSILQRQLEVYGKANNPKDQDHALKEVCYIASDKLGLDIKDEIIERIEHLDPNNRPF